MLKPAVLFFIIIIQNISLVYSVGAVNVPQSVVMSAELCKFIGHPNFQISTKPIKPETSPVLTTHTIDVDLSFDRVIDIKGKGANCIKGYIVGFVLMKNEDVFKIVNYTYLKREEKFKSPYAVSVGQKGSMLEGRKPNSVAGLGFSKLNHQRVGLWVHSGTSSLALFESDVISDLSPYVIGTSKVNLRDVNYFPAPDAPVGEITVLHDVTPDHVEIFAGSLRNKPFIR